MKQKLKKLITQAIVFPILCGAIYLSFSYVQTFMEPDSKFWKKLEYTKFLFIAVIVGTFAINALIIISKIELFLKSSEWINFIAQKFGNTEQKKSILQQANKQTKEIAKQNEKEAQKDISNILQNDATCQKILQGFLHL